MTGQGGKRNGGSGCHFLQSNYKNSLPPNFFPVKPPPVNLELTVFFLYKARYIKHMGMDVA